MAKSFFERFIDSIGKNEPFDYGGGIVLDPDPKKFKEIEDAAKSAFAGGAGADAFDQMRQERKDERLARQRAQAAATPVVTETTEEEDPDTTNTETTTEVTTTTPAVQSVLQDAEKGPKSGTIATSAQGIDKDDTTGLRPKRSARARQRLGMLASYQPSSSQSLLAGA